MRKRNLSGPLTLLVALVASTAPSFAQESIVTRLIPLGVYDREGRFVSGLKVDQLQVEGLPASARRVELDTSPRRIILLLDVSGSMDDMHYPPRWRLAEEIAKEFLSALGLDDSVALHVFAEKHEVLMPFTHDFQAVAARIDALPRPSTKEARRAHGRFTLLGDALAKILEAQDRESHFGDAIVLVSDGEYPDETRIRLNKLKHKLGGIGLRLFLLRVAGWDPPAYGSNAAEMLTAIPQFIRDTGGVTLDFWQAIPMPHGETFVHTDPRLTRSKAREAYSLVRNVYRVELELQGPIAKPHKITFKVTDGQRRKLKGAELIYPRYLVP